MGKPLLLTWEGKSRVGASPFNKLNHMELYSQVEYCSLYSCVMGFLSTVTDDLPEEETFTILARDIYFLCLFREWMKQTLVIWLKVVMKAHTS
jgi:hypothetical protein